MRKLLYLALLLLCAAPAWATHTCTTCYSDYENGCDKNDGTAKTQLSGTCPTGGVGPWKHVPGMQSIAPNGTSMNDACTDFCASQVAVAGDFYIMKGGVVWPYTVMPFVFPFSGTSSASKYGCTGSHCIYVGNAHDAGLTDWNKGIVTSVILTRDLPCSEGPPQGCWNSTTPTITLSGGGGSSAAATANVIPSTSGELAGFIYFITLSNQGSGYTSAPSCSFPTVSGVVKATCVADINRAVIDAGANAGSPPHWSVAGGTNPEPYCRVGSFDILAGIECRNWLIASYTGTTQVPGWLSTSGPSATLTDFYIHGMFTDCAYFGGSSCSNSTNEAQGLVSAYYPYSEISYGHVTNGDAFFLGLGPSVTPTICGSGNVAVLNLPCEYGESGIKGPTQGALGPVEIQHNTVQGGSWQIHIVGNAKSGSTDPYLIHDNETWGTMYSVNIGAHINRHYSILLSGNTGGGGAATWIEYNEIDHDHVGGSSNQQTCKPAVTFYFFNSVMWGNGTGTPPWGISSSAGSGGTGGCTISFFNDTTDNPQSGSSYVAWNTQTGVDATTITTQNMHAITGPSVQNPYWGGASNNTVQNQAGSTTTSAIQAASTVQSLSTANTQGYTTDNLFAPTSSSNDTITFASGSGTANLTSTICAALSSINATAGTACLFDINGQPRPATGGWNSGAYQGVFSAPGVGFSPTSVSFGSVSITNTQSGTVVTLTNTGTANLVITSIGISGTNSADFSVATSPSCNSGCTVSAGGTVTITPSFTPSLIGAESASISVADNASGSPQTVPMTGTGISQVSFTCLLLPCTTLNLGNVVVNTSSPIALVNLNNLSNATTLTGLSLSITGTNASLFSLGTPPNNCNTTSTVTASNFCAAGIVFTPTSVGNFMATLNFTDSAVGSPQTITLTGTGIAAPSINNGVALPFGFIPW